MTRMILFTAVDGATDLDLVGPIQVFATASGIAEAGGGDALYRIVVASISGGAIRTRAGLDIGTAPLAGIKIAGVDTVMVPGGRTATRAGAEPALVAWLARHGRSVRRICSVCVGAFLLGEAGLLDGRTVTTHWRSGAALQARNQSAIVRPDLIFQGDGPVWTSAGVSAGIDLALHLVEADHGRALAMEVAKTLVVFLRRPGGQAQFSSALALQGRNDPDFSELIAWAADHLSADLSVEALAQRAGMSPRTFARRFRAAIGQTPAAAMEALRLEAAKRMLEGGGPALKSIAAACGFADLQGLRRAFGRSLGVTPAEYRQRFR